MEGSESPTGVAEGWCGSTACPRRCPSWPAGAASAAMWGNIF